MNIGKLKNFIVRKLSAELSEKLSYHSVHHTLLVYNNCNSYIKRMKIDANDAYLLRTASLMHDVGYIWNFDDHEERSILFARQILPQLNYSDEEIDKVAGLIRATKIPQKPGNMLEEILADCDMDYLGTDKYYQLSEKLYHELISFNKVSNFEDWDRKQVSFLQNHHYHTPFAKKHREPVKQKYLNEILEKWGW